MTIAPGEKLPDATLKTMTDDGAANVSTGDFFAGKKVVLFGVPGAFTPTCSMNHLPGFLENHDAILAKGADAIAVVSVNDVFVMNAWSKSAGNDGKITFLADGSADFAKAAGLDNDLSKAGMGTRYKRFSMIVDDGVVKTLNIEETPGKAEISGAARILEQL
ncbi:peroxiredoxin [Mesorhizobium australicum]|uniref:Glutathione-dependent peroxiredoxin n=1 Tax=Mesorhizobium australicum TaxID=536018 RepID=A0A1X7NVA4_9HYPH|nr:peroxiredoxin [Mesorhizobium australicum]SMH41391.1 Peroxiredoxin [Mesorhizobium australicum]